MTATCALGAFGFTEHFHSAGEDKSLADIVYLTMQLFTMESGAVEGPMPPALELARFLGPLVSAYTVVSALVGLFSAEIHRWWIWFLGRHVVVCGMGRKGIRLVEQLRAAGKRVVVIEPDEQNPHIPQCRELGCHVVTGRANDAWHLGEAFVRRARLLVAVAGDDGVNIETAVRAHSVVDRRRGKPLRCIAHVADPNLQNIFRRHHVYTRSDDPFELELLNTYEMSARVMLREAEGMAPTGCVRRGAKHWMIIGLGCLGEALLLRILKDWHIDPPADASQLRITVIDVEADARQRHFQRRYPGLTQTAQVRFLALDIHDPNLASGDALRAADAQQADVPCAAPQAIFVCLDDDSQSLYAALTMQAVYGQETPLVARMSEESGLATVLGITGGSDGAAAGISAVGLLDAACSLEVVLGGTREILAQAIHQAYVGDQMAAGRSPQGDAALAPWHRLPEDLKDSNRQQADHIREKLRMVGCEIVPQPGFPPQMLEFTDDEVERLAEVEHRRWVDERKQAGWRYGPVKDVSAKINPHLMPWSELPESVRDTNRDAVRRTPLVLAKADFAIRRTTAAPAARPGMLNFLLRPRRRTPRPQAA
ncbi:MAG: NAD-binding protein [Planctomycetales bacterium]|nr:NAD-binding protein [Planctomycetales bacterium]